MQINPKAAGEAGLGNGKGKGLSDAELKDVNKDYIDNVYKVGPNIRAGGTYLQQRIDDYGGDVGKGLEAYRAGVGTTSGKAYSKKITSCADKVRAGDIKGGLRVIYPSGRISNSSGL